MNLKKMKFQVHCPKTRVIQLKNLKGKILKFNHNDIVNYDEVFVRYPHVFMPRPDLIENSVPNELISQKKIEVDENEVDEISNDENEVEIIKIKKGAYIVVDKTGDKIYPDNDATCKKKDADQFIKELKCELN